MGVEGAVTVGFEPREQRAQAAMQAPQGGKLRGRERGVANQAGADARAVLAFAVGADFAQHPPHFNFAIRQNNKMVAHIGPATGFVPTPDFPHIAMRRGTAMDNMVCNFAHRVHS